ncbi:MAG: 50S ribosomal protein L24e [Candidatus ainarchaeum sp.]|nr:50S ribosomal protein L24e [Candidatus ainarchaeum sp.]
MIWVPNCSFCSETLFKGSGILYVKRDGTPVYFCSGKCRKNSLKLKRQGRKKKWTKTFKEYKASTAKKDNKN